MRAGAGLTRRTANPLPIVPILSESWTERFSKRQAQKSPGQYRGLESMEKYEAQYFATTGLPQPNR
jgi:hypothetical protein